MRRLSASKWGISAALIAALACSLPARAADETPEDDTPALAGITPDEVLTIDALLTTVNGEPIFVKDIIRPLDADFRQMARQAPSLRAFKERAYAKLELQLRATVGHILSYSAAKDSLTEEELKRIDIIMNKQEKDLLARHKGARAQADAALRAKGSSVDKELANQRRDMIVQIYMHKQIAPKITVRRRDVLDEYEKNIKKYTIEPEVDLYIIAINVQRFLVKPASGGGDPQPIANPTVDDLRKAEAEAMGLGMKIHERLKKGEEFSAMAEEFSDLANAKQNGGRWNHLRKGTFIREDIEKKAFSMKPNTLAEPFISPAKDPKNAWVAVMKVGEVVEGRVKTFSEVQGAIKEDLQRKQENELMDAFYKKLYEEGAIDNKDRVKTLLETATNVVVARYAVK